MLETDEEGRIHVPGIGFVGWSLDQTDAYEALIREQHRPDRRFISLSWLWPFVSVNRWRLCEGCMHRPGNRHYSTCEHRGWAKDWRQARQGANADADRSPYSGVGGADVAP